jgi:hypothetical protein
MQIASIYALKYTFSYTPPKDPLEVASTNLYTPYYTFPIN